MILVEFTKQHSDVRTPKYATAGSACVDLYAWPRVDVPAHATVVTVGTGLSVAVPPGHVLLICSRSGHGFRHGVRLSNCTGIIDSDYRGEIKVQLRRDGDGWPWDCVGPDTAIAQALLVPIPHMAWREVGTLSTTTRGRSGFGSTDTEGGV